MDTLGGLLLIPTPTYWCRKQPPQMYVTVLVVVVGVRFWYMKGVENYIRKIGNIALRIRLFLRIILIMFVPVNTFGKDKLQYLRQISQQVEGSKFWSIDHSDEGGNRFYYTQVLFIFPSIGMLIELVFDYSHLICLRHLRRSHLWRCSCHRWLYLSLPFQNLFVTLSAVLSHLFVPSCMTDGSKPLHI